MIVCILLLTKKTYSSVNLKLKSLKFSNVIKTTLLWEINSTLYKPSIVIFKSRNYVKTTILRPDMTQILLLYKVWKKSVTIQDSISMKKADQIMISKVRLLHCVNKYLVEKLKFLMDNEMFNKNLIMFTHLEKKLMYFLLNCKNWKKNAKEIKWKSIVFENSMLLRKGKMLLKINE